jgi:hypothetical protein
VKAANQVNLVSLENQAKAVNQEMDPVEQQDSRDRHPEQDPDNSDKVMKLENLESPESLESQAKAANQPTKDLKEFQEHHSLKLWTTTSLWLICGFNQAAV